MVNINPYYPTVPHKKKRELQKCNSLFLWYHQESNRGHKDFQSFALPTELWHHPSSYKTRLQMITKLDLSSGTRPFQFGLQRGLNSCSCKERSLFRFHCVCKGKQNFQTCKIFPEILRISAFRIASEPDYPPPIYRPDCIRPGYGNAGHIQPAFRCNIPSTISGTRHPVRPVSPGCPARFVRPVA